jgi:hypothetical protein
MESLWTAFGQPIFKYANHTRCLGPITMVLSDVDVDSAEDYCIGRSANLKGI